MWPRAFFVAGGVIYATGLVVLLMVPLTNGPPTMLSVCVLALVALAHVAVGELLERKR